MAVLRRSLGDARGQILPLTALCLLALLAVAGLAVDGGKLFIERRSLQAAVDQAAAAAAQQVDEGEYRRSNGTNVILDTDKAYSAARTSLVQNGVPAYTISVMSRQVFVRGQRPVRTVFMGLIWPSLSQVTVYATGTGVPRYGIAAAQGGSP